MSLEVDGQPPIVLDLGTGLRRFGESQPLDGSFEGTALLTHLHWDHVQGLPFFPPIDRSGARLDIYGPAQKEGRLGEVFGGLMKPPYFPVHLRELRGTIEFHDVIDDEFDVGSASVTARPVPHCGPTVGYRVEWDGAVVAYVSDHQAPRSLDSVADSVLELCRGADLLIHDAQLTRAEFAEKAHWGHSTVDYAVLVAKRAGVRQLALFHHDPAHDDRRMDKLTAKAKHLGAACGIGVFGAKEGQVVSLGR